MGKHALIIPPVPPILLLAGLGAVYALYALAPGMNLMPVFLRLSGLVALVAAGVFFLPAAAVFFRRRTTISFNRSTSLVTTGIYRITRNPMYVALLLTLAGSAMVSGNVAALLVPVAAFLVLRRFIPLEEAKMEREMGRAYREYRDNTPRWL